MSDMEKPDNLEQEEMVAALLSHPTVAMAAQKLGVSESTLFRRLREPAFKEALRTARRNALDRLNTRIQSASELALETLEGVMRSDKAPDAAKVSAAKTVLDLGYRLYEAEELEGRLDELETWRRTREETCATK